MSDKGYVMVLCPQHPQARRGYVMEHRLVAEAAIGKTLRADAVVHHVNGDSTDNRPSNLVICHDQSYHVFLHVRARIVAAGGNPDTDLFCAGCDSAKPRSAFYPNRAKGSGRSNKCKDCDRSMRRERRSA